MLQPTMLLLLLQTMLLLLDVADSPRQLRSDATAEENSLWHNGDKQPEEWSNDFPTIKFPDTDCPVCGKPPGKNVR